MAGVGGAPGSMVGVCCMGRRTELADGEVITGVRAGLGRIAA